MGNKKDKYSNKPVRSSNENIIRRENGSMVLRKEKVFMDGSRLVEESYIDGSELATRNDIEEQQQQQQAMMTVPLVNASVYNNNNNNSSSSARKKEGSDQTMLQPNYNPDGWLPGVIMMMICRYSWCGFVWWIIIKIIQRIVINETTAGNVVTSTINNSYDNSYDPYDMYTNYGSSSAENGYCTTSTSLVSILIGLSLCVIDPEALF